MFESHEIGFVFVSTHLLKIFKKLFLFLSYRGNFHNLLILEWIMKPHLNVNSFYLIATIFVTLQFFSLFIILFSVALIVVYILNRHVVIETLSISRVSLKRLCKIRSSNNLQLVHGLYTKPSNPNLKWHYVPQRIIFCPKLKFKKRNGTLFNKCT